MRSNWLAGVAALLIGTQAWAAETGAPAAAPGKHIRLLAIGNSFSANATRYLRGIVDASGNHLTFQHICLPGCSLATHWKNAAAWELNPQGPRTNAYGLIKAEPWDYVTLQQYSMDSFKTNTYWPYARRLYGWIKQYNPQAEVLVHETWAYRADDPLFAEGSFTQQDMYTGLRNAYAAMAAALGCRIIPVGEAFERVRLDPDWPSAFPDLRYDYKQPQYPALPDQTHSLNMGYRWNKDKQGAWSLSMDGHHASPAGEYLGGAVWFEVLYGQSVVGNAFVPKELKPEDVRILQRIAHDTVAAAAHTPPAP